MSLIHHDDDFEKLYYKAKANERLTGILVEGLSKELFAQEDTIQGQKRQLNAYRFICLPMTIIAVIFILLYFTK